MRIERLRTDLSQRLDLVGHQIETELAGATAADLGLIQREFEGALGTQQETARRLASQGNESTRSAQPRMSMACNCGAALSTQ